ncbi:MAG TPA: hypothetical protein VGR53_03000 [Nitrososphaerales archaeon]|nr:hypothetical protein [Nitrososphaerales archaeon]
MRNVRGLRTRLCPKCNLLSRHRTIYTRTESGGRTRWLRLFWACMLCHSLNHIIIPTYKLKRASLPLPTPLALGVVKALADEQLDFDELVANLRRRRAHGAGHIFSSEVAMTLDYLKGHDVVAEEFQDRTERTFDSLRALSTESRRACPAEESLGVTRRSLASLYAQRRTGTGAGVRLVPIGAFCLHCHYHRISL